MHRVDTAGHAAGLWQDGNPQIGQQGTVMSAAWLNDIQENLCKVVLDADIALAKGNTGQLKAAIQAMITSSAVNWAPTISAGDAATLATAQNYADVVSAAAATAAQNAAVAMARVRPGVVEFFAGAVVPTGYLECNGAAVSRATYADLFAAIGTTYGPGNGTTTFNIPQAQGEFLRGWDNGRGVDDGRTLGSFQADEFKSHVHELPVRTNADSGAGWVEDAAGAGAPVSAQTAATGGSETRPRNIALMVIIKI